MEIEVIVQSILPSDGPQGRYRIKISVDDTVEQLLRKVCSEAHVPLKHSYCLRHAANQLLPREHNLNRCNIRNGELVHWTDEETIVSKPRGCNIWWFMCALSLLIGLIGLVAVSALKAQQPDRVFDYGIVMDAGSSHTSLFVYKWDGAKYRQTAEASQYGDTCKAPGGGISSYASNPQDVGTGLRHCLDFAKSIIPGDKWSTSPVYLGATAGMRLLNEVNSAQSNSVLKEVREVIKQYPFQFDDPETQVRIITGKEEGTFSWVTSNYIARSLNGNPVLTDSNTQSSKTLGALDMGGASAQISFIPENFTAMPSNYSFSVHLYGENYTLYTHSFLCYGVIEAQRRYDAALARAQNYSSTVIDYCAPKDYFKNRTYSSIFKAPCSSGVLDFELDAVDVNETFLFVGESNATYCKQFLDENLFSFNEICPFSSCSFNGQYQPHLFGSFNAFSTFYYVTNFLNLTDGQSTFTLQALKKSTDEFCSKSWQQVEQIPAVAPQNLPSYCFQANYITSMLTEGYKFNEESWKLLRFVEKIEKTDIGWSLGFMLNESNQIPVDEVKVEISTTLFVLLLILFAFFIIVAFGFVCLARRKITTESRGYKLFKNSYGAV